MAKLHSTPQNRCFTRAVNIARTLHYRPEWRSVRFLFWSIRFFFVNFELMDQTMQVSASDSQCASALRFAPAILAQRAQDQVALEAANFIFVRHHRRFSFRFDGNWLRD